MIDDRPIEEVIAQNISEVDQRAATNPNQRDQRAFAGAEEQRRKEAALEQESYWDTLERNSLGMQRQVAQNFFLRPILTRAYEGSRMTGQVEEGYNVFDEPELNQFDARYDKRAFTDIRNRADFEVRKQSIENERRTFDRPIADANALLTMGTGMIFDPANAVPFGKVVRTAAGTVSVARTAALGAVAAGTTNAAADYLQQSGADYRPDAVSSMAMNFALGAVLGGAIGGTIGARAKSREVAAALSEVGLPNARAAPLPKLDENTVSAEAVSPLSSRVVLDPGVKPLDGSFDPAQSGVIRAVREGDNLVIVDGQRRMATAQRDGVENVEVQVLDNLSAAEGRQARADRMLQDGRVTMEDLIADARLTPDRHVLDTDTSAYGLASRVARIDEDVLVALPGRGYGTDDLVAYGTIRWDLGDDALRRQFDVAMYDFDQNATKITLASRVAAGKEIARALREGDQVDLDVIRKRASAIDAITDRMQKPNAPELPDSIRC